MVRSSQSQMASSPQMMLPPATSTGIVSVRVSRRSAVRSLRSTATWRAT
jgi:hypothetical protein